jgi:Zn-dependent protease with chaperone function
MNTETINQRDIPAIAKQLRKKVNTLLLVYFLLIFGTIIFFLAVLAGSIFGAIFMISEEYFNFKIAALLLGLVIMAGVCVKVVLSPLLRMFDRREQIGTEIKRRDYPELFSVIDEIVKEAGCKFPRRVFIYNECNAFVNCRSIWGHLFNVRKNLTIGLPLLYTLNKTELKAILSHEFGHFTQKSIAINSIANLSEFICAAIARSLEQIEKADADSYEAKAQWFAELATKIMAKQYHNVAPLNGILSRAQEFDADMFSYSIAGTEASISALSKVSYFSERWDGIVSILYSYVENKRCPVDIYDCVKHFNDIGNDYGIKIDSGVILTEPQESIRLNVLLGDDTTTHPEMTDRCNAIKSKEKVDTVWDMAPALSYFAESTVRKQFNQIPDELAKVKFPYSTTTFFKKDVTMEELGELAKMRYNNFLQYFYNNRLFTSPEAWVEENEEHLEYASSPFTEVSSLILQKFGRDRQDLHMMEQIIEENSPQRIFSYFGKRYTGVNVPIHEHRELTEKSYAKAIETAKHCNYWLTKNTQNTPLAPYFNLMCASLATLSDLAGIQNYMEGVDHIYHSNDTSTKAMEYVHSIDKEYRRCIGYMLEANDKNQSRFTLIANWMNVKEDVIDNVKAYFYNDLGSNLKPMITSYQQIYGILNDFRQEAWKKIVLELIIPGAYIKAGETQETTMPEQDEA